MAKAAKKVSIARPSAVARKKAATKKAPAKKGIVKKSVAKRGPKPNPLKTAQRNLTLAEKLVSGLEKKLAAATAKRDKASVRVATLEAKAAGNTAPKVVSITAKSRFAA